MPTRFTMSVKLSKVEGKFQCVGLYGEDRAPQGGPMFLQIELFHCSLLPNLAVIELRQFKCVIYNGLNPGHTFQTLVLGILGKKAS